MDGRPRDIAVLESHLRAQTRQTQFPDDVVGEGPVLERLQKSVGRLVLSAQKHAPHRHQQEPIVWHHWSPGLPEYGASARRPAEIIVAVSAWKPAVAAQ